MDFSQEELEEHNDPLNYSLDGLSNSGSGLPAWLQAVQDFNKQ